MVRENSYQKKRVSVTRLRVYAPEKNPSFQIQLEEYGGTGMAAVVRELVRRWWRWCWCGGGDGAGAAAMAQLRK
jgi:hypothetical protein